MMKTPLPLLESAKAQDEIRRLRQRVADLEAANEQLVENSLNSYESSQVSGDHNQRLKLSLDASRRQLDQIAKVHARFLPHHYPRMSGLEFAAHCRPCADIGGDIYDAYQLPDGRIAITIADVAGHGAIAAVTMAAVRAVLRAQLLELPQDNGPAYALWKLATLLRADFEDDQFTTMWLGIWNPATETLSFACAAHPPAVIWRAGEQDPKFLGCENTFPLGIAGVDPVLPEERSIELSLGDRVFLYTDAWNESTSAEGEVLEHEGFLDFIGNAAGQPLKMANSILFMMLERHSANSMIRDDVSLMIFERVE